MSIGLAGASANKGTDDRLVCTRERLGEDKADG